MERSAMARELQPGRSRSIPRTVSGMGPDQGGEEKSDYAARRRASIARAQAATDELLRLLAGPARLRSTFNSGG